jgi:uncharacterized protein with NAD-binding domain and iron-sulfur cluster
VLSVTFSNVNAQGVVYQKPLLECTREELFEEILTQCNFTQRELIIDWHMDDAIVWMTDDAYQMQQTQLPVHDKHYRKDGSWILNFSPLSTPTPGSFANEPTSKTLTPNLYLAGDFCKTSRVINCMEKACESAYLAVDAISRDIGLPKITLPFKAYNIRKYRLIRTLDAIIFKIQQVIKLRFFKPTGVNL